MIVFHDIFRFFHAKLFVERYSLFIGHKIYSNLRFPAAHLMGFLHQLPADALPLIFSVHAEIRNKQPVGIIG